MPKENGRLQSTIDYTSESDSNPTSDLYIAQSRIDELKTIRNNKFDFTRLVKLCEELNIAFQNGCVLTIPMLIRTIINHVPPIFSCKDFSGVANNYSWPKSQKNGITRLNNSLKDNADFNLHIKIRDKEILPSLSSVDFRTDLDILISEIVRILRPDKT